MLTIIRAQSANENADAVRIQLAVFSDEQGIPRETCLAENENAHHVLAMDCDNAVATARLLELDDGVGEIARVAVIREHRGAGLGHRLVRELETVARELGLRRLILHPHHYLEAFYSGHGYEKTDDAVETVGGHELITMSKSL